MVAARELFFHPLARRDFLEARRYYAEHESEELADSFRNAVNDAADRIARDPESLPIVDGAHRYLRMRRFPYLLIFRIPDDDRVIIVAVAHTSRRPGYWKRRT